MVKDGNKCQQGLVRLESRTRLRHWKTHEHCAKEDRHWSLFVIVCNVALHFAFWNFMSHLCRIDGKCKAGRAIDYRGRLRLTNQNQSIVLIYSRIGLGDKNSFGIRSHCYCYVHYLILHVMSIPILGLFHLQISTGKPKWKRMPLFQSGHWSPMWSNQWSLQLWWECDWWQLRFVSCK